MRLFDDPQEQVHAPLVKMHDFVGDPICRVDLATADYATTATDITRCGIAAVNLLEGRYAIGALGSAVASFLHGFKQRGGLSGARV